MAVIRSRFCRGVLRAFGTGKVQLALGTLHGDLLALDRGGDALGDGDRFLADA
jgi:hypothetical protein